jgi:DALR anticodon binding domain
VPDGLPLHGLPLYRGLAWRSGGVAGRYVCRAAEPDTLAAELSRQPWVKAATIRNDYITVVVTAEALERVAVEVAQAGPACVTSDALRGQTVPAPRHAAAPGWEAAKRAVAAEVTARLAAAAGAEIITSERETTARYDLDPGVAAAVAYAGPDAVRFALARTPPGGRVPGRDDIARHVLGNPAYAVRYAHAAAAAVLRWAGTQPGEFRPRRLTAPGELALLDALSWLPERVAVAARRGRPDEFARYLETLASRTIDIMSTTSYRPSPASIPGERLWLAQAARTGLAAGLGLLRITAPDRL